MSVQFPAKSIRVADLLNSTLMVGQYRGEETWRNLEKLMDGAARATLVLIDIREAMPLQYTFCQYAFGPLFKALDDGRWHDKFVIFRMLDFHRSGFFRGVLKHLQADLPRKDAEKEFVRAGFCAKLIVGDDKQISFVGDLTQDQVQTLSAVNRLTRVTARQLVATLSLSEESIVDTLRFLVSKWLIAAGGTGTQDAHIYYSLYKYLDEGETP